MCYLFLALEQGRNSDLSLRLHTACFLAAFLTFSCYIFNYLEQVNFEGRSEARCVAWKPSRTPQGQPRDPLTAILNAGPG